MFPQPIVSCDFCLGKFLNIHCFPIIYTDPEPKIKQNDILTESAPKINKRRRRIKAESSKATKDVESPSLESTKIEGEKFEI